MTLYTTSSGSLAGFPRLCNHSVNLLAAGVELHWKGTKANLPMPSCSYTRQQYGTLGLSRDQLATVEVYMI
jgi:hypothetical protein